MDGHHKLRWKLVTHGAIDGKARTIVFLKCSSNNRAGTVLHQFMLAIERFCLSSCIRIRVEKADVWRYMLHMHNTLAAVIAESSTRNEHIERLNTMCLFFGKVVSGLLLCCVALSFFLSF